MIVASTMVFVRSVLVLVEVRFVFLALVYLLLRRVVRLIVALLTS
jgi:hypothetical protein